jgi:8-oxo-dGTP pyrophosphatase MutT (NUDIX family)
MQPRPAATLILVRDPYEVLMVRRNPALAFMGGFWVFPGGKVEEDDGSPEQAARRELLEEVSVELPANAELIPFARWITPLGLPVRFDTWFFLAHADGAAGAEAPTADDSEIVEARWVAPQTALTDGSPLAFPTRKQLERLAGFVTAAALIDGSRGLTVEPVLPEVVRDNGAPAVVIPGSGDAPVPAPEMPTAAPDSSS